MFKRSIQLFFRNLRKQKFIGAYSITGLSIGIAVTIIIGLWGYNELTYDTFHKNYSEIYRVGRKGIINNESLLVGSVFSPIGPTALNSVPEVKSMVRVFPIGKSVLKVNDKPYYEDNILAVDSNFFTFFNFQLVKGNPETCLSSPNNIVIDEEFSKKYFKGQDPIGKMIKFRKEWQVKAIMKNSSDNSHIKFHALVPINGLDDINNLSWGQNDGFNTYFRIERNANIEIIENKIGKIALENFPLYKQVTIKHFLQPLRDIHLTPGFRFDKAITIDKRLVYSLLIISTLILIIACINFTNLFISTSFIRAKSIGIKKTNGSSKRALIAEFFSETSIYVILSLIFGIILAMLIIPIFNQMQEVNLKLDFFDWKIYAVIGSIFLLTILMAGTFPAFYITKFNPVASIKGIFRGKRISLTQKSLVIVQFTATIILLLTFVFIKKQLHFVENKKLGFDKSNILYIRSNKQFDSKYDYIKQELLKNPNIYEITSKDCLPTEWVNGLPVSLNKNKDQNHIMEVCRIKPNYFDMLKMEIIQGRNPFTKNNQNLKNCLLNEQALKILDIQNPIGKSIYTNGYRYTIQGILKNANTKSLHQSVDPQVYLNLSKNSYHNVIFFKIQNNYQSAIKDIRNMWKSNNPDIPFKYHFLNEQYDKLYKDERKTAKLVNAGMIIAIFLALMGLFAISHYSTERRIKEIGIRKTNGASVHEVLLNINKEYFSWILISIMLAFPLSYIAIKKWLENFAYKITIEWWIFIVIGIFTIFIALLTVSWQSWRAARRNPVEALRYE